MEMANITRIDTLFAKCTLQFPAKHLLQDEGETEISLLNI